MPRPLQWIQLKGDAMNLHDLPLDQLRELMKLSAAEGGIRGVTIIGTKTYVKHSRDVSKRSLAHGFLRSCQKTSLPKVMQ
jgi:hypothetical protein